MDKVQKFIEDAVQSLTDALRHVPADDTPVVDPRLIAARTLAGSVLADRACPKCRKEAEQELRLWRLHDLHQDRMGIVFTQCQHCQTLLRVHKVDVSMGNQHWSNYYITVAGS